MVEIDVSSLLQDQEREVVNRWVVVVETYDLERNEKFVIVHSTDGMESYDVEGLLRRAIRSVIADEDDEGEELE